MAEETNLVPLHTLHAPTSEMRGDLLERAGKRGGRALRDDRGDAALEPLVAPYL